MIFARVRLLKPVEESIDLHQKSDADSVLGHSAGYGPTALVRILRFIANLIDPAHNDLEVAR